MKAMASVSGGKDSMSMVLRLWEFQKVYLEPKIRWEIGC